MSTIIIPGLEAFYKQNPNFDILHFNLSDQTEVSRLNWQGLDQPSIMHLLTAYQRVLRLYPADPKVAMALLGASAPPEGTTELPTSSKVALQSSQVAAQQQSAGTAPITTNGSPRPLNSAQAIAAMPEAQFVKQVAQAVGGEDVARHVHQNARAVTAKIMHLWANIHNAVASPYSRAMRVNNVGDDLQSLENLPNYEELFGSLNFCECDECRSIFGPAAYFVDLMRIIDQYITTPNEASIDPLFQLNERRPDLALIPLTCENTTSLVPYLSIVNDILAVRTAHIVEPKQAAPLSQNDAINAAYKALASATYSFNLPFNLPLEQIRSYLGQLNTDLTSLYKTFNVAPEVVAREALGLSPEEYTLIITSRPNAADLTAVYGVKVTSDSDLGGLENQDTFRKQTGLSRQELEDLLTQNLSQEELNAGLAHAFYFNQILDKDHPLQLGTDKSIITNLNMAALDRLQRFIRLAKKLNWSFADLDWVLRSLHASEITAELIQSLAAIKQVQARVNVPAVMLSSLWYDLKTIGVGTSKASQAPFDIIFNNPQWLGRQPTYHPGNPGPTDAAPPTPYELNPLYKDNVLSTPAATSRFAVALGMSLDNFATLAAIVNPNLKLTVPVCSLLYRHTLLASLVKLPLEQYLLLLQLTNKQQTLQLTEELQPKALFKLEDLQYLLDSVDWLRSSGLTVYDLTYVLKGTTSRYVTGKYKEEDILFFLQSLQTLAIPAQPALAASDILDWTDLLQKLNSPPLSSLERRIWNVLKPDVQELIKRLVEKAKDPQSQLVGNITPTPNEQTTLVEALNGVLQGAKDSSADLNMPAAVTTLLQSGTILSENEIKKLNRLVLEAAFPRDIVKGAIRQIGDEWKEKLNQQLATFVGSTPDMVTAFMEIIGHLVPLPSGAQSYIEAFYNQDEASVNYVEQVLDALSRGLVLAEKLQLKSAEIDSVRIAPASYGFPPNFQAITIDNLKSLFVFKQLTAAFQDTQNQLCTYLATASDPKAADNLPVKLARITGWTEEQISAVLQNHFSQNPSALLTTVAGLATLKRMFDLITSMGVDFSYDVTIRPLATLSAKDDNNHTWSVYTSTAQLVINTVKTRYNDDDWAKISSDIESRLSEMKRDALTGFVLWKLGQEDSSIKNLRNLSEYLLIDVEMTGCASISPIKQGLLSLQMYLQRCRMNLEPGANTTHIDEVWWEWMMNYRIWEANREVFLYPENYIDPSLRKSKSDLFSELESELLQSDITQESVEAAYKNYFDKFAELAKLRVAASYRCFVKRPGGTTADDTLFLFGRSATEPPTYYYRECTDPTVPHPTWTPWSKIDININSDYISPVFAFNKLFVFWVEIKETTDSSTNNGKTTKTTIKKATIKYIFQTLGADWVQPQTLVKDRVINVSPSDYRPSDIDFNTEDLVWKKVYPLAIPEPGSQHEKILIMFGDLPRIPTAEPEPPQPGTPEGTNMVVALFENQIYKALQQAYRASQDHYQGYFSLIPATTLTSDLSTEERFLTLPMKLIKMSVNDENLQARSDFATTVVGNLAFFAGGFGSDVVDIFDAQTRQWIKDKNGQPFTLSQARSNIATTVAGNLAFFAGGYASSGCSAVVDIFDAQTRQWITDKDKNGQPQPFTLSQARYRVKAVTVGNLAIFAGGIYVKDNAGYDSDRVDIFDADAKQWIKDKNGQPFTLSTARSELAATTVGNLAIFAGGAVPDPGDAYWGESAVVDIFDAQTRQWIKDKNGQPFTLSMARGDIAATTVGNLAIFAGGFGSDVVDIFDAQTRQWITDKLSRVVGNPFAATAVTVGNLAIVAAPLVPNNAIMIDIFAPPSTIVGVIDRAKFKVITLDNVLLANNAGAPRPYIDNVLLANNTGSRPYIPRPHGYWPLDEESGTIIHDLFGSNDGTLQGKLSQKWTEVTDFPGTSSRAVLQFGDGGNYVSLPQESIPSGKEITVSFWAYGGSTLPNPQSTKETSVIEAKDGQGNRILNIHLPWSDRAIYFHCGTASGGDVGIDNVHTEALSPDEYTGKWTHWAFTKNASGEMRIYRNGIQLPGEVDSKQQALTAATTVTLGCGCRFASNQWGEYREYDGFIA
ncbi:MAG: neuraminidase-like domain-containing protein, partial [Ktedonobacteraceae bacterium]